MSFFKFALTYQLKRPKPAQTNGGFTLIELLAALILAFLIITPLLGFVVNLLNSDRQEQAKTNTEQEIQAALEFIARDMEQAVYVYDTDALTNNHAAIPPSGAIPRSGIKNQIPNCPQNTTCEPVLAFWKRLNLQKVVPFNHAPVPGATLPQTYCTGLAFGSPGRQRNCNDASVYALVVYYSIKDETCGNSTWSCASRIGRFELRDGVRGVDNNYLAENGTGNDAVLRRDRGFQSFDLDKQGTLSQKLEAWTNTGEAFDQPINILVDYIVPNDNPATDKGFRTTYSYKALDPTGTNNRDVSAVNITVVGNAFSRMRRGEPPQYDTSPDSRSAAYFPQANIQIRPGGVLNDS